MPETIRLEQELHAKLLIIAKYKNISLEELIKEVLAEYAESILIIEEK